MKSVLILSLLSIIFFNYGCAQQKENSNMSRKPVSQVIEERQDELFSIPGVQGFYEGAGDTGETVIVVMVDSLTEDLRKSLPDSLDGYPVKIDAGGVVRPLIKGKKSDSPEE